MCLCLCISQTNELNVASQSLYCLYLDGRGSWWHAYRRLASLDTPEWNPFDNNPRTFLSRTLLLVSCTKYIAEGHAKGKIQCKLVFRNLQKDHPGLSEFHSSNQSEHNGEPYLSQEIPKEGRNKFKHPQGCMCTCVHEFMNTLPGFERPEPRPVHGCRRMRR